MQAAAMMKLSMRHKHAQVWPGEDETAADPSRERTLSHDDSFRSPRSPSPTNFKNLKFKAASPLAKDGRKHESKLERSTENDALTRNLENGPKQRRRKQRQKENPFGSHDKTKEEIIAMAVLWLALIAHLGKMGRKLDIAVKKGCVFGPNSTFRTYWDSVSMLFILYVIAFTPLQVAFLTPPLMETSMTTADNWGSHYGCDKGQVPCFNYWGIFVMDLIIDIFFTADIFVNFRSAWIDTDPYSPMFKSVRYSCKMASCRYLKGMLFVDVLSVLPFWVLDLSPALGQSGSLLRVPRLLRLFKLMKLLKVLRASRIFGRWNKAITTTCSSTAAMLIELAVVLSISVHLMGCTWYLIASMQFGYEQEYEDKYGPASNTPTTPNTTNTTSPLSTTPYERPLPEEWWEDSWITQLPGYQTSSLYELYLASIFYAIGTITGVGTNIVPVIFSERLTAFICMVIGVTIFAYVVGQVTVLIHSCTERRNLFFEDMSTLLIYLRSYPFDSAMRTRTIDYFYYTYENKQYHFDTSARRNTISHFSPFLQRSLAYAELKHFLIGRDKHAELLKDGDDVQWSYPDPLPFLEGASEHIIRDLCAKLNTEVYGPIEIVAYQGGPCSKMYTLDQGSMCKWSNSYKNGEAQLAKWSYVDKGGRFGADALLMHLDPYKTNRISSHIRLATWYQSFQTLTFCDFITLTGEQFTSVLRRYPKQVKAMRRAILGAKFRTFSRSILHLDEADKAMLESILRRTEKPVRSRDRLMTVSQQMTALREENSSLKNMVQRIEQTMEKQQQTLAQQDKLMQEQQQRAEEVAKEQQQRTENMLKQQQQRMEEAMQETLARQHLELVKLLQSSNK